MGLTRKLLVRFGAVMAVLLVTGILLVILLTYHSRKLDSVLHENYDSVLFCERMNFSLNSMQTIARNQLLSGSAADPAAIKSFTQTFEENAQSQINNHTLAGEREKSLQIVAFWKRYLAAFSAVSAADPSARADLFQRELLTAFHDLDAAIDEVLKMNLRNLAQVNAGIREALLQIRSAVIALVAIALALLAFLVLFTARDLTRPLWQLTESVNRVKKGDLDAVISVSSKDEIGTLAQAFNDMAAKLREFRRIDAERLLRTQQTTQAAIDSLPDAVAVLDATGNIEIANKTAQQHFALKPGANLRQVRPEWTQKFFDEVLATGKPLATDGYRSSIQIFDESGERFLLPRCVPILNDHGSAIGVTLVLVEVTHLRRADEFRSGLLATASHELKTPLTSIRMAMRMLLDKRIGELNPKQELLLNAAKTDSERLVRILEDILTIGRVESGESAASMKTVNLAELVPQALASVQRLVAEKNISVVTRDQCRRPLVRGDSAMLATVLTNLFSNAAKYSPHDSTVTVTVAENGVGEVVVSVRDQGPGIPEEFRARIFEKFFRIPSASGPSGAGLGLAIAKEIAVLHGGALELAPEPGPGSTFILRIPRLVESPVTVP